MQGGLRLAATLNAIFEPSDEETIKDGDVAERDLLNLDWLVEAETRERVRKVIELVQ